jgi:fructokinase
MGQITLDVQLWPEGRLTAGAGGTCGNVLAWLAWLGWSAHAVGQVGSDEAGAFVRRELSLAGVDCSALLASPWGATPVVVHRFSSAGSSFDGCCPRCGAALPDVVALDPRHVATLPTHLPADVFFFDRDSEAALLLARAYRASGARIWYEPNYVGPEVPLAACLAVADVVKGSQEAVPELAELAREAGVPWGIETRGEAGLRWSSAGGEWQHQPPWGHAVVRDAAGCGDATTAGAIHAWHQGGTYEHALNFGQILAAWTAGFPHVRGGLDLLPRWRILDALQRLAAGESFDPAAAVPFSFRPAPPFCPECPSR